MNGAWNKLGLVIKTLIDEDSVQQKAMRKVSLAVIELRKERYTGNGTEY